VSDSKIVAVCKDCYKTNDDPSRGRPDEGAKCERCAKKPAEYFVWVTTRYSSG